MVKKRYSETEIFNILKEYEGGKSIIDICKDYNIAVPTFYVWRRKYLLKSTTHKENRIKVLENENFRLKQMYVELSLNYWNLRGKITGKVLD